MLRSSLYLLLKWRSSLGPSHLTVQCVHLATKPTPAVQEEDEREAHHAIKVRPVIFNKSTNELIDCQNIPDGIYVKLKNKSKTKILPESQPRLVGGITAKDLDWHEQVVETQDLPRYYLQLGKSKLSALVVATSVAGYILAPAPFDPLSFMFCMVGTGLTSFAANTINQILEVPFDSQMNRTKNRVLVRGLLSPVHAANFAAVCVVGGLGFLYFGVNGLCASLGLANLILYTSMYTPMKRISIVNTWIGSVVGGIPPLMGWVACTGTLDIGAFMLAGILYAWQFPHFNALSWNLRQDYSRAGYRMMCASHPNLCRKTTVRYSAGLLGLCILCPVLNVTTWTFTVDSLPFNLWMMYLSWKFYEDGDSSSSRRLFRFSLIYLPCVMMLMLISKQR